MRRKTTRTKPGPAPSGHGFKVGARIRPELFKRVERFAKRELMDRGDTFRFLIERGLESMRY